MVFATLLGASLIVNVALDAGAGAMPGTGTAWLQPSMRQQDKVLQPLVRTATECIAAEVIGDSRFDDTLRPVEIGDLIVDAMAACAAPVRAMIEAHDRMFGWGSGEAFFMGPYLEVLPAAVSRQAKAR